MDDGADNEVVPQPQLELPRFQTLETRVLNRCELPSPGQRETQPPTYSGQPRVRRGSRPVPGLIDKSTHPSPLSAVNPPPFNITFDPCDRRHCSHLPIDCINHRRRHQIDGAQPFYLFFHRSSHPSSFSVQIAPRFYSRPQWRRRSSWHICSQEREFPSPVQPQWAIANSLVASTTAGTTPTVPTEQADGRGGVDGSS